MWVTIVLYIIAVAVVLYCMRLLGQGHKKAQEWTEGEGSCLLSAQQDIRSRNVLANVQYIRAVFRRR